MQVLAFHVQMRLHSFKKYSLCTHSLPGPKAAATNSFLNYNRGQLYNLYTWVHRKLPKFPRGSLEGKVQCDAHQLLEGAWYT